jgi:glycosyltransferase involved in cell wall biosynthesis
MSLNYSILKRYFNRTVAVSNDIRKVLLSREKFRPDQVTSIHNGIGLVHPVPQGRSITGQVHIGTVGRMVAVKNYDLFLEVAAELKKEVNNVRFSILGNGPLQMSLTRRVKDLRLENEVTFYSPRLDPFPYYRSLDIYLNTSFHEGIPLTILEAMSCQKPVIAPSVGGIPEIITSGEQGLLVEDYTPGGFVRGCLPLLNNFELRKVLGENAFKRVSTCFSDYHMAESYKKVYYE